MENITEPYKILNSISNPVLIASPLYDNQNKIIDFYINYVNPVYSKLTKNFSYAGQKYSDIYSLLPDTIDWFNYGIDTIQTGTSHAGTYKSERTGIWFHMTMDRTEDKLIIITLTNISAVKKQEEELHYIVFNDRLTELPNRRYFNQIIDVVIAKAIRTGKCIGLMLIDIDNLKEINDISGHEAGDAVIKKCARILLGFSRDTIKSFRLGDDEYLVLVTDLDSKDRMVNTADAIFEAFQMEEINISAGISMCPQDNILATNLLKYVDLAMHEVKKNGKNSVLFYSETLYNNFMYQTMLQHKILKAVENMSFELYYQPQFNIKTNMLRGFEALLRWYDETLGWINPEEFIPVAEETHSIRKLGQWVLEEAIQTLKRWQTQYTFEGIMSVNVSPVQLDQKDFLVQLQMLIEKYGIDPKKLEIEITEGVFIENIDETVILLNQIKNLGVLISLDDFGTGYSSFRYLQCLPLTTLKIDKSFISNLSELNGPESNITGSIISLVSKLGLDTIAEGVENTSQLNILKTMNCENIQGFLRGKPMNIEHCNALLNGDKTALIRIGTEPLDMLHIKKEEPTV